MIKYNIPNGKILTKSNQLNGEKIKSFVSLAFSGEIKMSYTSLKNVSSYDEVNITCVIFFESGNYCFLRDIITECLIAVDFLDIELLINDYNKHHEYINFMVDCGFLSSEDKNLIWVEYQKRETLNTLSFSIINTIFPENDIIKI